MSDSDDDLVDRARTGDREAFCALLERHRVVALRVGYTIAGDEAEDAVQEAMIKAFRHLDRFRPGAPFRPWLLAIVANEARNRRRVHGRQQALKLRVTTNSLVDLAEPSAEATALALDQHARLLVAVTALPDRDREIVALRYFAGLSEVETSAALDCPVGTVKSRLSRALERLRLALAPEAVT